MVSHRNSIHGYGLGLIAFVAALGGCSSATQASGEALQGVALLQCPSGSPWAAGKAYAVGDIVTFGGKTYSVLQAHTSQAGWTPDVVPALFSAVNCATGTAGGGGGPTQPTGGTGTPCGPTPGDPGGQGSPSGGGGAPSGGGGTGPVNPPGGTGTTTGNAGAVVFGPYKDTSINMNWNTNVISTNVSGTPTPFAQSLSGAGGKTVSLAFATGECGSENWGGVPGDALAKANVGLLQSAGVKFILSTGGAAGSFTCSSDAGMESFLSRWSSPNLIGVDFDIEAGQSQAVIGDLVARIKTAHGAHPGLRWSLTLATLAVSAAGSSTAQSLGANATDSLNFYGDNTLAAVKSTFGFDGSAATWPSYVTVNLMTMDYGSASNGVCVVSGGTCQMGQSAIQAAYNLHDKFGVPYSNIELTPMIGGNDVSSEQFTLADAATVTQFAVARGLAGVHYWSYDRDVDCAPGSASATCNSLGNAGTLGFLKSFVAAGLH